MTDAGKREAFLEAVSKAMEEQVVPLLFSPGQLVDMQMPYHSKWDHYSPSSLITREKGFARFYDVKPQLGISDPRITQEQIDRAPKSIKVEFEGQELDVPLRVFSYSAGKDVAKWQDQMAFQYVTREAVDKLEDGLKQKFNLAAGEDYSIGYGIGSDGKQRVASYMVQVFSDAAKNVEPDMQKYMEEALATTITPGRPSRVTMTGPVVAL